MYKNRKFGQIGNNSAKNKENNVNKRPLNPIDENRSVKFTRQDSAISTHAAVISAAVGGAGLEDIFSSEEHIPASQEPTQRYLSQRSIAATLTRTQSRNISQRPPNTYFELVLMQAGVQLDEGDNFVLSCDHVSFVTKFREKFVRSQNYPDNVETFKAGLRDALVSKCKLSHKLLSGCTISVPGEESVYQSQDSMIVNFLMIDFLRDHVLDVLLDKIEAATKDNTLPVANGNVPLLPLMLTQLRHVTASHGELIYIRIKRIFEQASESAKWEIIANAEFVLNAGKHDEFAQLLLDNLSGSHEFFHATTMQTLTSLCLSTRMQGKLRGKVLSYIKEDKCPISMLPVLMKFLLKALNEDSDDVARELVNTIREILIFRTNPATGGMERQTQIALFDCIQQTLIRSRKFYYAWQKTIAALPPAQFRSIDFIMLLLFIHIKEDNSLYVENILRRRIKHEHISVEILHEAKSKYVVILEQHTNTLMQILHDFLREKHKLVIDFARASYGILFELCDSIQKNILKNLLVLTCDKSTLNMTTLALELLKELQRKHAKDVQNWGMLLLPLLDRLNEVSLSQTRLIMEILCSVAFPAPTLTECNSLQDQIDMLVKKQIISRNALVKKQGILSSVQLIDCIARIEETCMNMDDFNTTFNTVNDLPDGRGKIAATYIMRIQSSAIYCAESLALFYDELATVCAASPRDRTNNGHFDKPFLMWLCELLTYAFQNNYVAEHAPDTVCGLELSYQKCINSSADTNTEDHETEVLSVAINISELVLKPSVEACASILVLAPHFNLVRVLHSLRNEGSLEQINALLGCAIILPSFFDDSNTDAIFYNYDEQQQKKIMDIYFHCVNWMRETVSSFSTQRESMIRNKVLQRLTDLIQIEHKIRKLLLRVPADYAPPMCQFICAYNSYAAGIAAKTAGRGRPVTAGTAAPQKGIRSRAKGNQTESEALTLNETNANSTHFGDITSAKLAGIGKKGTLVKTNFDHLYGPKEIYRQMDSDIMLILREKLSMEFPLPQEEIGQKIGLCELRFILTDLVCKLESITGVQKFQNEQTLQYLAKPDYFMCDLSKFLSIIVDNMEMISKAVMAQLEHVQYVYSHADLFTEEFSYLKVCLGLCLRLQAAFFSWSEFMDTTRVELLKEALLACLEYKKSYQLRGKSAAFLATEVFSKCLLYKTYIVDLKTAVHFYQLLVTLKRYSTLADGASEVSTADASKKQTHDMRVLCKMLLCRKWFNYDGTLEKGATCNIYLDTLVRGFLQDSDFRRQREIARVILEESKQLSGKDNSLKSFPNIKKANFPILFRGLCEVLLSSLSEKITKNDVSSGDVLKVWENSCSLLNILLEIVQALDVPRNFQLFLKYAHLYLKLVLQHGLPVFEKYLRESPERVSDLLKSLQVTTRFLHNLCVHSKALKKISIISQIPFLRETVENLLFRVKALLAANKCASVFWMGCLKNKDLHGDEVMSQAASLGSGIDQEDSDEEIPDDASVDETVMDQNETTVGDISSKSSSRSKCF